MSSHLLQSLTFRTHTFSITMSNPRSPEFFELSDPHPQSSPTPRAHPASTGTVQSVDRALAVVTGPETEEPTMAQHEKETHAQTNEEYTEFDPMADIGRFNCKTELEDKWDEIQGEMVPFLREFAEQAIASTLSQKMTDDLITSELID